MASSDIFRCNRCCSHLRIFKNDSSTDHPRNYLTSCQHLLCERCQTSDHAKCAYCGKKAKFCPITKDLPFNLRLLFQPFENAHKIVTQVNHFQQTQNRLIPHRLFDSINRYTQGISELNKLEKVQIEEDKKMMNQYQKLRSIVMEKMNKGYALRKKSIFGIIEKNRCTVFAFRNRLRRQLPYPRNTQRVYKTQPSQYRTHQPQNTSQHSDSSPTATFLSQDSLPSRWNNSMDKIGCTSL